MHEGPHPARPSTKPSIPELAVGLQNRIGVDGHLATTSLTVGSWRRCEHTEPQGVATGRLPEGRGYARPGMSRNTIMLCLFLDSTSVE